MKRAKQRLRRREHQSPGPGKRRRASFRAPGSADGPGFRERLLTRLLIPLAPALVGHSPDLPEVDSRRAAAAAAEMICRGPFEVFLTVVWGVVTLNIYSLLMTGRRLNSLRRRRQSDLLAGAFHSRFFLLRGTSVLVGLPIKVAFYNQEDVCRELGFDRGALIEDALKHQVTRGS